MWSAVSARSANCGPPFSMPHQLLNGTRLLCPKMILLIDVIDQPRLGRFTEQCVTRVWQGQGFTFQCRSLNLPTPPRRHLFPGSKAGNTLQAKMSPLFRRAPDLSEQFTKVTSCLSEFADIHQASMVTAHQCMSS